MNVEGKWNLFDNLQSFEVHFCSGLGADNARIENGCSKYSTNVQLTVASDFRLALHEPNVIAE